MARNINIPALNDKYRQKKQLRAAALSCLDGVSSVTFLGAQFLSLSMSQLSLQLVLLRDLDPNTHAVLTTRPSKHQLPCSWATAGHTH